MGKAKGGDWVQCGREFSTQEIRKIRETVAWLPGLARGELAATVCEHLDWHTAAGTPKIQACQKLLERLEAAGVVELPSIKRQKAPAGKRAGVRLSERTATKTYRPLPVKRCWIEKPGKPEKRPLGIPVIKDRLIQMAAKLVMEPIFETNFLPCSYGFRGERDAPMAIREAGYPLDASTTYM